MLLHSCPDTSLSYMLISLSRLNGLVRVLLWAGFLICRDWAYSPEVLKGGKL